MSGELLDLPTDLLVKMLGKQVVDLYLAGELEPDGSAAPDAIPGEELADLAGTYANHYLAQVMEVTVEEDEMRVRFGGEPWVIVRAEGAGDLELFRDGQRRSLSVEVGERGARLGVAREGRSEQFYEPVNVAPREDVAAYAGRYYSEELDATWEVVLGEDGELVLHLSPLDDSQLEPLYEDAFTWEWGHARFERDSQGAITRMSMGTGRAAHMKMKRLP